MPLQELFHFHLDLGNFHPRLTCQKQTYCICLYCSHVTNDRFAHRPLGANPTSGNSCCQHSWRQPPERSCHPYLSGPPIAPDFALRIHRHSPHQSTPADLLADTVLSSDHSRASSSGASRTSAWNHWPGKRRPMFGSVLAKVVKFLLGRNADILHYRKLFSIILILWVSTPVLKYRTGGRPCHGVLRNIETSPGLR